MTGGSISLGSLTSENDVSSANTGFLVDSNGQFLVKQGGANTGYLQLRSGQLRIVTSNFSVIGSTVSVTGTINASAGSITGDLSIGTRTTLKSTTGASGVAGLQVTDGSNTAILTAASQSFGLTSLTDVIGSTSTTGDQNFLQNQFQGTNGAAIVHSSTPFQWNNDLSGTQSSWSGSTSSSGWFRSNTGERATNCAMIGSQVIGAGETTTYENHLEKIVPVNNSTRASLGVSLFVKGRDWQFYGDNARVNACLLYTSPSPRDKRGCGMPDSG